MATKRLHKELKELLESPMKNFRDIQVDGPNILTWQGLIVPDNPPYDKGAFRIEINFPTDYPFTPPKITFKTKIYHPRILENGVVCFCQRSNGIRSTGPDPWFRKNYNPGFRMNKVIQFFIDLLNDPESFGPLGYSCARDQAREYLQDRETFLKKAEEFTKKHGEKRPMD